MNADEAQKCLLVARRLMQEAESGAGDPAKANAALDRAMKYAEKGKRLDAIAVGPMADAMIARIRATQRTVGADGGPSPSSGSGGGGGGGGGNAHGQKQAPRRAASASASQQQQRTATKKEEIVKGTPEQEALIAKIRRTADYYEILGVARDAGDDEIKKGYRKMALRLHPDKCKATGAEEVFKSVSKAFACLSDPDKRAAYDRYGTEDPSGSLGRGGGGGHARHDADEDFDPAEIFNMFFGGGFPGGPGVRFRTHGGGGAARAAQHEREQQARRARQAHNARRGGGDGEDAAADIFRNLFNLLPLMLVFLMYFLAPGQEEHYALNRSPTFAHGLTTHRLEVPYYVKSMDAFEDAFPEATRQRQRVEHQIELSHLNSLENNCLYERQQQQRMYRFGSKHERQRAREMVLNSCERLQNLRQNKAYGHRLGVR